MRPRSLDRWTVPAPIRGLDPPTIVSCLPLQAASLLSSLSNMDMDASNSLLSAVRGLAQSMARKNDLSVGDLAGGLTFHKLVERLDTMNRRTPPDRSAAGLISSAAMQSVIEYKWKHFGRDRWLSSVWVFLSFGLTFMVRR